MAKTNRTYKETYNACLDYIVSLGEGACLPPEKEMAGKWSISRSTVRAVLDHLSEEKIIHWKGREKTVLRLPSKADYFQASETRPTADLIEPAFMQYIVGGDLAPGTVLRESELAKSFGVSASSVREYLIRFSRFGLIEKKPNRYWVLNGFTREFAMELFDVREMFELRAFDAFAKLPSDHADWGKLAALADEHRYLQEDMDSRYMLFPRLDDRFHRLIIAAFHNRFADDFYDLVALIFHYHYRWNKTGEKDRNADAVVEHLSVIIALQEGDIDGARKHFQDHLQTARRTLLASVAWD
ncbi:GntR family transcriptional regulator [Thalassospira marina]|uniref:GntR family transcriptional regulator n=1 Tax=Thalassospira marina TaxID=2048283 RepID=A0A2N3KES8_9PROT|nr:GntR family transcriptional regulator [Thalassospira marina]PKR49082.1 GntR family transcriptional regulator [Thalassospira marina]